MIFKNLALIRRIERRANRKEWHNWFAWRPVKLQTETEIAWLHHIERKQISVCKSSTYYEYEWIYRRKKEANNEN